MLDFSLDSVQAKIKPDYRRKTYLPSLKVIHVYGPAGSCDLRGPSHLKTFRNAQVKFCVV